MAKFLDENGLLYLWEKIKSTFVKKDGNKVLSTNDYTTAEKNKLTAIEAGANKTIVEDVLTSASVTNALSANQGKQLNKKIDDVVNSMGSLGYGDMMKATYDADGDGIVDKASNATNLNGQPATFYAKASDIPKVTNDLTDALMQNYNTAYSHSQATHAPADAEKNTIINIKKNGTALTPDSARAVNITVPTKVSELTNDKGYLVKHQDITGKADKATTLLGYGITDAYTKNETDSAITTAVANAGHLKREIVSKLPLVASADIHTIYMVQEDSTSSNNKYVEYMVINNAWEKVGTSDVDLTGYWQTSALTAITNSDIDALPAL